MVADLVLLIFCDDVRDVTLSLVELHLVHAFSRVQMQEHLSLARFSHVVRLSDLIGSCLDFTGCKP